MKKILFYKVGAFIALLAISGVMVFCYAQNKTSHMNLNFEEESGLGPVLRLAERYKETSDRDALKQLAAMADDPYQGGNAIAAIGQIKSSINSNDLRNIVLPALIRGLKSAYPDARQQAAIEFAEDFTDVIEPAVPALISVAENRDEEVNAAPFAVDALGKLTGAGRSRTNIIQCLLSILNRQELPQLAAGGYGDASIRVRAAEAIGRIGATNRLVQARLRGALMDSSPYVRAAAAGALLRNSNQIEQASGAINDLMRDSDLAARQFALEVLDGLPVIPISLRPALLSAERDPDLANSARTLLKRMETGSQ